MAPSGQEVNSCKAVYRQLVTIITEAVLESELTVSWSKAPAATPSQRRGAGGSRGIRDAGWDEVRNIRIEVICEEAVAEAIMDHLQAHYYDNFAMVIFSSEIRVRRANKFHGVQVTAQATGSMFFRQTREEGNGATTATEAKLGIIMGSPRIGRPCRRGADARRAGCAPEVRVVSAHARRICCSSMATAQERGLQVIIAGAGGAAHLPGMVAAKSLLPVLGCRWNPSAQRHGLLALHRADAQGHSGGHSGHIGTAGAANAVCWRPACWPIRIRYCVRRWLIFRAGRRAGAGATGSEDRTVGGMHAVDLAAGQLAHAGARCRAPLGIECRIVDEQASRWLRRSGRPKLPGLVRAGGAG